MVEASTTLTGQEQENLSQYGEVLRQYISPQIKSYSIMRRKRPTSNRLEAERISSERDSLQERLGIGWKWQPVGRWRLEMVGASENPGDSQYGDEGYWWILPLNSRRRDYLEYLAKKVLPKVFDGKKFVVRDTMIPCEGDCSWDCA